MKTAPNVSRNTARPTEEKHVCLRNHPELSMDTVLNPSTQAAGAPKHWSDDIKRADNIVDDELERQLGRLGIDERSDILSPSRTCASSWPLTQPRGGKASASLPPSSTLGDFGKINTRPGVVSSAKAPSLTQHTLNDNLYAWPFTPDWSLDANGVATAKALQALPLGDSDAKYYASPTFESVHSSDTESSGRSSYDRAFSLSPPPKQSGEFPALPDPKTLASLGFYDLAERNQVKPHPERHQTSFSNASAMDHNPATYDSTSRLLAATSPQSLLIHQLQELQSWQSHQSHSSMDFSRVGDVFPPANKGPLLRQWRNMRIPEGPSPKNRKVELYKTEMCRNWEELGACEYGSRCQFAHGEEELRFVARDPRWKTKPCRSFQQYGSCPYAKRCCFRHDQGNNNFKAASPTQSRGSLLQRVGLLPGFNASTPTGASSAPYF